MESAVASIVIVRSATVEFTWWIPGGLSSKLPPSGIVGSRIGHAGMFDVILYQPEIPPNTGNIIRLCANTGVRLHLVKPLGFTLEDKQLLRAGLDYHEFATITVHDSWAECADRFKGRRLLAVSTKGTQQYDQVSYVVGDAFVFGPESRGLPAEIRGAVPDCQCIRIPMVPGNRSLNLSNAVAVVVYEAWRQIGFVREQ
jgi:tRNA (cytidine/uridine-2'-O-)-methyltransferase